LQAGALPVLANYNLADFEMITAGVGELKISPLITIISQDSTQRFHNKSWLYE
jgi:hypothetical protein